MAEAAASQEVDPSTILRIRTVAKAGEEGGVQARRCNLEKAVELEAANAEVVRFAHNLRPAPNRPRSRGDERGYLCDGRPDPVPAGPDPV